MVDQRYLRWCVECADRDLDIIENAWISTSVREANVVVRDLESGAEY